MEKAKQEKPRVKDSTSIRPWVELSVVMLLLYIVALLW